jgi:hypothetical protein
MSEWKEERCQRERDRRLCNNLLGYTQQREGYVLLYCRKCNAWTIRGSAAFFPAQVPENLTTE